jgi:hypothetical protein
MRWKRAVDPAAQDQVAAEPLAAGRERREVHPHLQRDVGLLRQHIYRPMPDTAASTASKAARTCGAELTMCWSA